MHTIDHSDDAGADASARRMDLAKVDLNLLVSLDALLSECHVTRAAERTSVTQSAMSASLARLRRHFDDYLLVKRGRSLVRTPLANALVRPVRDAIDAAEAVLIRPGDFDPAADSATISFMAADYVTLVFLKPFLKFISTEAPNMQITISSPKVDFGNQLRRGVVDFVILPAELSDPVPVFPKIELFSDRFVVVMDDDNPRGKNGLTIGDLTSLRFVAFDGGSFNPILDTDLDVLGVNLQVAITVDAFILAPLLIRGSPLAAITMERLAVPFAETGELRTVECPLPLRTINEIMYWDPRSNDNPACRWLRGRLMEFCATF